MLPPVLGRRSTTHPHEADPIVFASESCIRFAYARIAFASAPEYPGMLM
jgi:hypothetical protein